MSRQLSEILSICTQIIAEQKRLLQQMESQHQAMKTLDVPSMEGLVSAQEDTRLRITMFDNRRKVLAKQIAAQLKLSGEPTLTKLAELFPAQGPAILKTRDDLRDAIERIQRRSQMSSKLCGAVLGHLNTVGRLIAGAMRRAGIYTKQGVREITGRIGVMDAVG
jgi:hypothetical protein